MIQYFKAIWDICNGPNNSPILIAFGIGWVALALAFIRIYFSYRAILKEKDKRIEDIIETRNFFQDLFLQQYRIERKSTKEKEN